MTAGGWFRFAVKFVLKIGGKFVLANIFAGLFVVSRMKGFWFLFVADQLREAFLSDVRSEVAQPARKTSAQ